MSIRSKIEELSRELPEGVTLVAVSKTHPVEAISEAYDAGQRIFGESRPQELKSKYDALPKDIRWHMIGNLQTNKVKYIAPFVGLIHSVDNSRLLEVINKEGGKNNRRINVLLEVHIASEESKIGWDIAELRGYINSMAFGEFENIELRGLMAIASLTGDESQLRREFMALKDLFDEFRPLVGDRFDTLSMGMTADYPIAIDCGATMVRICSLIFGERDYPVK